MERKKKYEKIQGGIGRTRRNEEQETMRGEMGEKRSKILCQEKWGQKKRSKRILNRKCQTTSEPNTNELAGICYDLYTGQIDHSCFAVKYFIMYGFGDVGPYLTSPNQHPTNPTTNSQKHPRANNDGQFVDLLQSISKLRITTNWQLSLAIL